MQPGQIGQAYVLGKQLAVPVGEVGLAGQGCRQRRWGHGVLPGDEAVGVGMAGVPGVGSMDRPGRSVSSSVARCAAAGSVGRYSGPFWPQADNASKADAASATRPAATQAGRIAPAKILLMHNIAKL